MTNKNTTTQKDKKKNEELIERRNDRQMNRKQCKKTKQGTGLPGEFQ